MKTTDKFNFKKQHLFTDALVDGKWFVVSHFAKVNNIMRVWICADHGFESRFVFCDDVAQWIMIEE